MTTFLRVLSTPPDQKAHALLAGVRGTGEIFDTHVDHFSRLPGSPFAYWTPPTLLSVFDRCSPISESTCEAVTGASTKQDPRFIRLKWEVGIERIGTSEAETYDGRSWILTTRGGRFSRFHEDLDSVIFWADAGAEIKTFISQYYDAHGWGYRWNAALNGHDHYFEAGLTWPLRGETLSVRLVPRGCIPGLAGKMAFAPEVDLHLLLAISNSKVFDALIRLFAGKVGGVQYEAGLFNRIPTPIPDNVSRLGLEALARRAWSLKRLLDTTNETSHAFVLPPGTLGYEASPLHPAAGGFNRADIHRELAEIQAAIDDEVFALYGISDEDRATIEASMSGGASSESAAEGAEDESPVEDGGSDDDESESSVELTATTLTTYSWLVGVAFGRFDPRLATRERAIPPEPEPFDPLPARSPGMWPEGERPDAVPPDIMVDDPGHDHDIRMLVANAAANTGWPDPEDLRHWLAKEFFPLHIKMYSKSRRKAPIYWQLATPSASYSVWLYVHAFTKDTLFRVQNDYVAPKLAHEQRKLESLQAASQKGQTAAERKELATQEALVDELGGFLDEVKRVAPVWNPNLDDGVIINFSLLWRLVPQHKPWQKELESTWGAVCAGKYDWAHLAMHLWPERVVPKCVEDRSLAIAHGLEDVFWHEDSDGKWQPRKVAEPDVEKLVKERTSAAVKDALKSLLEAPAPATGRATRKKAPRAKGTRKRAASARPKAATNGAASSGRSSAAVDAELLSKVKDAIGSNGDGASKADVIDATGISASEWNKAIKALLADGSVTQTGERRGARYHLAGGDA